MSNVDTNTSWLAWMVERRCPVRRSPQYLTIGPSGSEWTDDPLIGLHFVRREDAERFSYLSNKVESISQHEFVGPESPHEACKDKT